MRLADLCVRRPVFATMLVASLVVLGVQALTRLGVDLFPKVDIPTVTIMTTLQGASPEEVETQITKPIEEAVNTVSGVDELVSVSTEGRSYVIVRFVLERDIEQAAQDVRDKVATILRDFPQGTDPPVIEKFDIDAAPVMSIAVSANRDLREVTEIADKQVKQGLEGLSGVGAVTMVGGRKREVHVLVDADRLRAFGLTIQQVRAALQAQNVEVPAGRLDEGRRELVVRTMGRVQAVRDFHNVILATVGGTPITVADVGRVEDTVEEPRQLSRLDGKSAVTLLVRKQSGTNTVEVIKGVKRRLGTLAARLPRDVTLQVVRDQSLFINKSLEEIQLHLILGGLLASLVILFFIRDLRSTFIAALAIPTSIVATFAAMRYLDLTLNTMTMMGLTLSVGIVIDDAIVVLENIFRFIEEKGMPPMEAARAATAEIGLAVMATTFSLVAVFIPMAFLGGVPGRFLYHFAVTMTVAILVSLLVSFTLTPMLCSRMLRRTGRGPSKESRLYRLLDRGYAGLLGWALGHRAAVVLGAGAIFLSTFYLADRVGKDFLPYDDQNEFEIVVQAPAGYSLKAMDALLDALEADARKLRGVEHLLTSIGIGQGGNPGDVTQASIYVRLVDLERRGFSQFAVMREARQMLQRYPDLRTSVQNVSAVGGGGFRQTPVNFNIRGSDLDTLERLAQAVMARMRQIPGFVDVDTTLADRRPEVRVLIERKKAADLGVQVADIAASLNVLVGGEEVSKFKEADDQYPVRLRLRPEDRSGAAALEKLTVSSRHGPVPLNNLVALSEERGPAQIDRQARQRQITIVSNLETDKPLGEAISDILGIMRGLDVPPGYVYDFTGRGKIFQELMWNFFLALVLSLIFMYMILAAQFESFLHPITIMLSLPLSVPFALLSLYVTGTLLHFYSMLGIFLLFGIVKKNSILQVDFALGLQRQGLPRDEAVLAASRTRLRPILMTTITLVAGMLPVAFGKGAGSVSRAAVAIVVIGGQSLALLLTLLATPVAFTLFDDLLHARPLAWAREALGQAPGGLLGRLLHGRLFNSRRGP
ncbi:MAG: efflux RND transporter permease subunit [Deltaproteobacteria bacterium]|nr:efflux RND transporter permease subunit [Deltaproteobacteria bacterium]MBI3075685.1 efflux RND transporter permease subunit [Deltaproteobacteria bacterium]